MAHGLLRSQRMRFDSLVRQLPVFFSFALCCVLVTLCGCSTTYQATAPRPVRVGDVEASVERLRDKRIAEVHVTDVGSSHEGVPPLKAARMGATNRKPCASGQLLWDPSEKPAQPSHERLELALPSTIGALSRRGLTLDLTFDDADSTCVRLPITSEGDEVLWRGPRGVGGSGHLRLEWPMGSVGGVGATLTAEMRIHYPVQLGGTWRLALALPFGAGGCRSNCPSLSWDDDNGLMGVFWHLGAAASVARAISFGRWLILPALGFRTSAYLLAASSAWEGDRVALLAGPVVSLGILRSYVDSPPGFDPAPVSRRGVELTLGALRAYDRAPEGVVWMLGLGWTFVDEE